MVIDSEIFFQVFQHPIENYLSLGRFKNNLIGNFNASLTTFQLPEMLLVL
jgi:hypothetical protein